MFSWLRAVAGENTSGGRIPSPTAKNPPRRHPSFGRLHQGDSDSVVASASPSTSLGALTRSTVLRVILSDSTELVEVLSKDELVERASGSGSIVPRSGPRPHSRPAAGQKVGLPEQP